MNLSFHAYLSGVAVLLVLAIVLIGVFFTRRQLGYISCPAETVKEFSNCSCSYGCVKKDQGRDVFDCARHCPNAPKR